MASTITTAKKEVEVILDSVFEVAKDTAKLDNPVLAAAVAGFVLKVLPVGIPATAISGGVLAVGGIAVTVRKIVEKVKADVESVPTTITHL